MDGAVPAAVHLQGGRSRGTFVMIRGLYDKPGREGRAEHARRPAPRLKAAPRRSRDALDLARWLVARRSTR